MSPPIATADSQSSTVVDVRRLKSGASGKVEDLRELVELLRMAFADEEVDVELVSSLMKAYRSDPHDWKKYAKFDKHRYTRNLVDEGNGRYNLMLVCWGEGQGSSIHDHSASHCFMKCLYGELEETRFAWPKSPVAADGPTSSAVTPEGQPLQEMSRSRISLDQVAYISDEIGLHRVENPSSSEVAVSLHLYIPPFEECHVFNQQTGRRLSVRLVFHSKYGKRTHRRADEEEEEAPEDN